MKIKQSLALVKEKVIGLKDKRVLIQKYKKKLMNVIYYKGFDLKKKKSLIYFKFNLLK